MAVTAELRVKFSGVETSASDFADPTFTPILDRLMQFSSGTGANMADIVFADERTLAASATEDLDLAGVLTSAFGATISAAEVVAIIVEAAAANTNSVVIGAATSPIPLFGGTLGTFSLPPGGIFCVAAPGAAGLLTVGAGATDDLKILNGGAGTSVTYKIIVLGRSA